MTMTSFPFSNQDTSEGQYSDLFRELQDSGVVGSIGSGGLKITADGTGMRVIMAPGAAIVRGHMFTSTAAETINVEASSTQNRMDTIVLRLDPAEDRIVPVVLKGTPGSGARPGGTQTDSGIYDLPIGYVNVRANSPTIIPTDIPNAVDIRTWVGSRVGVWTTSNRPADPRISKLGYNTQTGEFEFWNGTIWKALGGTTDWAAITNKPTTFPSTWTTVTGKPTTFAPSTHAHEYASLYGAYGYGLVNSGGPNVLSMRWGDNRIKFRVDVTEFDLATINDLNNINSALVNYINAKTAAGAGGGGGGTVALAERANGSDRPHAATPAGSGWYAVWVDGNHNFCRNTSSIRYKKNIKNYEFQNPKGVLALQPVKYDRRDVTDPDTGEVTKGATNELGLIAEAVAEHVPEIVVYHEGQIDSVRYDLLALAMLPVMQEQQKAIADLTARLDAAGL